MTNDPIHSKSPEVLASTAPVAPRRRRLAVTLLFLTAIFAAGAATGGSVATFMIHRAFHNFVHHPERIPDHVIPMLKRTLKLTDEQFTQVERIIRTHHRNLEKIRDEAVPKLQSEFEELDLEMTKLLDVHQQKEWKHHFEHVRKMWFPIKDRSR